MYSAKATTHNEKLKTEGRDKVTYDAAKRDKRKASLKAELQEIIGRLDFECGIIIAGYFIDPIGGEMRIERYGPKSIWELLTALDKDIVKEAIAKSRPVVPRTKIVWSKEGGKIPATEPLFYSTDEEFAVNVKPKDYLSFIRNHLNYSYGTDI
jgi:hypothetical protein